MLQAWEPTIVHFPPALPPLVFASCVNDTLRAAPVPIPRLALCRKLALPLLPAGTTCQELMPQPSAVFELSTILVGGESRDVVVAHFPAWALFTVQGLMSWLDEGLMRWLIALECCVFRLVFERESRERIMLAHFLAWSSYIVVFFAICDGALLPAKARYKYYVDKGFVEGEDERLVEAWNLEWNQYCRLRQEQRHEVSVRRRQLLNRLRSRLRRRQAPRSLKEMRCRPCSELRANRWSVLVFLRRCKRRGIGGLFCGQARARPTSRAELSVDDEGNVQMRLCVLPQRSLWLRTSGSLADFINNIRWIELRKLMAKVGQGGAPEANTLRPPSAPPSPPSTPPPVPLAAPSPPPPSPALGKEVEAVACEEDSSYPLCARARGTCSNAQSCACSSGLERACSHRPPSGSRASVSHPAPPLPPSPSPLPPPLPPEPLPLLLEPLPPTGKSCSRRTSSSTTTISPLLRSLLMPVCLPLLTAKNVDALFERFPVRSERASAYAAFSDYSCTSKALEHTLQPLATQHLPLLAPAPSLGNAFEARGGGGPLAFGASLPPPHRAIVQLADRTSSKLEWEPWQVQHSSTGVSFHCLSLVGAGLRKEWSPDLEWRPFQPQKPSRLSVTDKKCLEANSVITQQLWEKGGQLCEPPSIGATIELLAEDHTPWLVKRDSDKVGLVLQTCDENTPLRSRVWNPSMPWRSIKSPAEHPFAVVKMGTNRKGFTISYAVSHAHDARAVDLGSAGRGVCWKTLFSSQNGSALQPLLGRERDVCAPYDMLKCMAECGVVKYAEAGRKRAAAAERERYSKKKEEGVKKGPESNKDKAKRAERDKIRQQCVSAFQRSHACICARSQRCAHSFLDSLCLHCCV